MAANPMKGEADLGEHKLIVNFNRLCSLEAVTGLKVPELMRELQAEDGLGFMSLRSWVRVLLDSEMSSEAVGEMIDELGLEVVLKAVAKAVENFFAPLAKDKKPRPPKAG